MHIFIYVLCACVSPDPSLVRCKCYYDICTLAKRACACVFGRDGGGGEGVLMVYERGDGASRRDARARGFCGRGFVLVQMRARAQRRELSGGQ